MRMVIALMSVAALATIGARIQLAVASPLEAAASPRMSPAWNVDAQYPVPLRTLEAVSCPSASSCVAVGSDSSNSGAIVATTDGGVTWTREGVPSGVTNLDAVSCGTVAACVAVGTVYDNSTSTAGGVILTTTDGGATWTSQTASSGASYLYGVSCSSASSCVTVGDIVDGTTNVSSGAILTTTDGGATWTSQTVSSGASYLYGVSCSSATTCMAVGGYTNPATNVSSGAILTTSDGGTTWVNQAMPGGVTSLSGVSCSSATTCMAVGGYTNPATNVSSGAILVTPDGGSTWTNENAPSGATQWSSVACVTVADCVVIGPSATGAVLIIATQDDGAAWSNQTAPSGATALHGVSCASITACVAIGENDKTVTSVSEGTVITTTDGGTTWTNGVIPTGVDVLNSASCPSTTDCVAVGGDTDGGVIVTTVDSGAAWTNRNVLGATRDLYGVSCPTTSDCVVVGQTDVSGAIFTTTDGGSTWAAETVPSGVSYLDAVSCSSTTDCVAVGADYTGTPGNFVGVILATTDGGTTWTKDAVPSGVYALVGASCPTAADCVVVGMSPPLGAILTTNDGGTTWTSEVVPNTVTRLNRVACTSSVDCTAVGYATNSTTGANAGAIVATNDGGTTWTAETVPGGSSILSGVSCPTTSQCVAVGESGAYPEFVGVILTTEDDGATWTNETVPGGAEQLNGVECTSTASCFAVGQGTGSVGGMILSGGISGSGPSITTTTVPNGTIGSPYSAPVVATGGTTPYSWSVASGSLPNGLVLYPTTGVVLGTPTAAGTFSFTAEVTDANGLTATQALSVTITPAPYTPLPPTRICDTRAGNPSGLSGAAAQCNGPSGGGDPLVANVPYPITVAGQFSVPIDATAVVVNVTVVNPQNAGYLTVYPAGGSIPTASNVNFTTGAVVPNLVEVGLGANGQLDLVANTATDVVVDLEGYVAPTSPNGTGSGLYVPLSTPARICDTRTGNPSNLSGSATQCDGKTLSANTPQSVQVEGIGGVPASGVEAVVVNVTVVNPTNSGYLTLYPQGTGTPPTASNVNFTTGEVVPNRVIVPVSATGALDMVANTATDAIIDVSGWYSTSGGSGTSFTPLSSPVRICDTRAGNPSNLSGADAQCNGQSGAGDPLGTTTTHTITVTGLAGVPTDAKAVVLNVTAVSPTTATYLTVFPSGTPPTVSDLNPTPGDVEANLVVATVSPTGTVDIYNNAGSANVVVDVAGWYS